MPQKTYFLEESLGDISLHEIIPEESLGDVSFPESIPEEATSKEIPSEEIVFDAAEEEFLLGEGALASAEDPFSPVENSLGAVKNRNYKPVSITLSDAALKKLRSWEHDDQDILHSWDNTDTHYTGYYEFSFSGKVEIYGVDDVEEKEEEEEEGEDEDEEDSQEDHATVFYTYGFFVKEGDTVTIEDIHHNVNIDSSIYGGTVTADKARARSGETVTLTVTLMDDDFELISLTVKGSDQKEVTVTDGKFIMPSGDVTVNARFNRAPVMPSL